MGRLIDADVLIEELKMQCADCMECKERSIGGIVKGAINDCIKIVDRQPTAYDVDAVVKQLDRECIPIYDEDSETRVKVIGKNEAIDIIRNGGK